MEEVTMKTKLVLTAFLILFIVSVSNSYAQPMDDKPMDDGIMRMGRRMMDLPDLTTDQITAIHKLRIEHQKEMLPIRTKLHAQRLELQALMLQEPNQKQLDNKIEQIGEIRTELMKKRMAHRLKIRDLLTDEQKAIFDTQGFGKFGRFGRGFHGGHFNKCFDKPRPRHRNR